MITQLATRVEALEKQGQNASAQPPATPFLFQSSITNNISTGGDTDPHLQVRADMDLYITRVLDLVIQLATRVDALEKKDQKDENTITI